MLGLARLVCCPAADMTCHILLLLRPLPSYGQLEMVLEAAAAGGIGASKFLAAMKTISSTCTGTQGQTGIAAADIQG